MKRRLALAVASIVTLSVLILPPAHADVQPFPCSLADFLTDNECDQVDNDNVGDLEPLNWNGTNCVARQRKGSNGDIDKRTVCVTINTRDWTPQSDLEALIDWNIPEKFNSDTTKIQVEWIRLYRFGDQAILKFKNATGWFADCRPSYCVPDDWGTSHDSWYYCPSELVYAKVKYRLKWMDLPGDPVGTYHTQNSNSYAC